MLNLRQSIADLMAPAGGDQAPDFPPTLPARPDVIAKIDDVLARHKGRTVVDIDVFVDTLLDLRRQAGQEWLGT